MTLEERNKSLVNYLAASGQAQSIMSRLKGFEITSLEIQTALQEYFALDDPVLLLDKALSVERMLEILQNYDFKKLRPELLAEVIFDESIIPEGVPRLLTEEKVKYKGDIWYIHRNDADPFPSNPHAHNYSSDVKLSLSNGELYHGRRRIGSINKKRLLAFRERVHHIMLPDLTV